MNLSSVCLVAVDGSKSRQRLDLLIKIAEYARKSIQFNSIKIFTGCEDIPTMSDIEFKHVNIPSIPVYNRFILQQLHMHIPCEHCIIFQHDGFIINPGEWTDEFLQYDYIGALFKHKKHSEEIVGNGGFSFRTRALMEFVATIKNKNFRKHEDVTICVDHRKTVEQAGFVFAKPGIAGRFSLEEPTKYNTDIDKSFGFHGSSKRPHMYKRTQDIINDILS